LISYLLFSKWSNSFVITPDKIIAINPNFLCKKYVEFDKSDVQKITIQSFSNIIGYFFLIGNQHFLQIECKNKVEKFYCVGLGHDSYYDEIECWTEKSLEDLHTALEKSGIDTYMEL
jgi:hypothetical protein